MAYEVDGLDFSFTAGEDLSSAQHRFMDLNSDGEVVVAGATGPYTIGILQNTPADGKPANVRLAGISKLAVSPTGLYGETGIAPNTFLSSDSTGRGVGETGAGYQPKYVKGRTLDSTLLYDQLASVEIISSNPAS